MKSLPYYFLVAFTALSLNVAHAQFTLDPPSAAQYNSIVQQGIRKPGVKTEADYLLLTPAQKTEQRNYYDGLGRNLATVAVRGSATTQQDIVQLYAYDKMGRPDTVFLPYMATTTNGDLSARGTMVKAQKNFYNIAGDYIENSTVPFGVNIYEISPLTYVKEQGAPGADWQPGAHTVRQTYYLNAASTVRLWNEDMTSSAYYGANEILIEETTDENGNLTQTYTDKAGRIIQKRVQITASEWAQTLYIYKADGQLKAILQPEGVKILAAGTNIPTSISDHHAIFFTYDTQGRIVEKKVPGSAPVFYCYDPLGRLALTQDARQRLVNKWSFIKYDRNGRPVIQGFYTNATHLTRTAMQTNVLDVLVYATGETFYEKRQAATTHGYSNQSFPTTGTEITAVSYYDSYDLDVNGTADFSYTGQAINYTTPEGELLAEGPQANTVGRVTATKVNVLGTATWITSYVFYDKNGNVIQVRKNNHLSSAVDNLVTNLYDFTGKLWYSKTYHKAGVSNITTVISRYEYDAAGRLLKIFQKNNSDAEQQIVTYKYNALGQMIDKKLHGPEVSALQSVDYRYNIRGWLTSINNSQLSNDADKNDDAGDYFGMELLYNQTETGLNNDAGDLVNWNGNISAIKWKGNIASGLAGQRGYKFRYDKYDRLESAVFKQVNTTSWNTSLNAFNETMTYDHNGNLKTLQRNDRKHQLSGVVASYTSRQIDNLGYVYTSAGNQLSQVNETATEVGGFINGANGGADYTYDATGSLTADQNKGISSVTYNLLGKCELVTFAGNGGTIAYTYDGAGTKLKMVVTKGATVTTTDYVDGFVYENTALQFFGSPEGRVVKNGNALEYQYAIADHQGNTRVVFTSANVAPVAPEATFEGTGSDSTTRYRNVTAGNIVPFIAANHTTSGNKVIQMNQTYKVGPSKSVRVYPGDKIDMEVWEYHENSSGFGTTSTPLATMINLVSAAFGGVSGAPGEPGMIYSGVNGSLTVIPPGGNAGANQPAAYLNYILFDKNYNFLNGGWQIVPAATFTKQKVSIPTLNITEPGYVFVYLSYDNDSPNWVYFDDFKVTHTKTRVIQYNEYYPFGLQTANSWTRTANKNDYLYNSGSELNASTGWYDMAFREYDPATGRMLQIDPMTVKYASLTPYNYAFDNPVMWSDPSGADPFDEFLLDLFINSQGERKYNGAEVAKMFADYETGGAGGVDWNSYGTDMASSGCSYCGGELGDYASGAAVENEYGLWVKTAKGWVDLSTTEQRIRRFQFEMLEMFGTQGEQETINEWGEFFKDARTAASAGRGLASIRKVIEKEFVKQARINRAISGSFKTPINHSLRTITKFSKTLGIAGVTASWGILLSEVIQGTDKPSTWVNATVNTALLGAALLGGPVTIAVAGGLGIAYGVSYLIYGDEIDSFIDSNANKLEDWINQKLD